MLSGCKYFIEEEEVFKKFITQQLHFWFGKVDEEENLKKGGAILKSSMEALQGMSL